ncbi:MAG: hypothetical protein ACRD3V_19000 [Vicinamibacteria bacterium]
MRFEPGAGGRLVEVYDEKRGEVFEIGRILDVEAREVEVIALPGPVLELNPGSLGGPTAT